jgi:hypothetical protein
MNLKLLAWLVKRSKLQGDPWTDHAESLITDLPPIDLDGEIRFPGQVIQQLGSMLRDQRFHRLELKYGPVADDRVDPVALSERPEDHVDRLLEPDVRHPVSEFSFVNSLVQKSAEPVVNLKYVAHHLERQLAELELRESEKRLTEQ